MNTSGVGNPVALYLSPNPPNAVGVWCPLVAGWTSFTLAAWLASDPAGILAQALQNPNP